MRTVAILLLMVLTELSQAAPLGFEQALERLQERNTELQTQKFTLQRTRAEHLNNIANFLPTLKAEASDTQTQQPQFFQQQQAQLVGSMNLFRSFADRAAWRSGDAAIDRDELLLRQTELDSEQSSLQLLIQYIQTDLRLRVEATILDLSSELAEIENARFKRGLVPLQDSQKAVVEKSNALARMQDAQASFKTARSHLATQLGFDQADKENGEPLILADWPWKKVLQVELAQKWFKKEFNLTASPAYKATQKSADVENFKMRGEFRELLPTLDLTVGYGYQDYRNNKDMGWQTTLLLTIPLMDLRQHANYRVQAQQEALARVNVEKAKRAFITDWTSVRERLILALKSAHERESSKQMAQSLYQDNQRRLRAGRSSMNDVLLDQNRLSEAEKLAINGWADAHLLYAQMCHLMGQRVNSVRFGCVN